MKKLSINLTMYLCMFVAVFCVMTLKVEAANTTTGTLGGRDSIVWTYDEDTKTLTLTGDGKLETVDWYGYDDETLVSICPDVVSIKVQNCKLSSCNHMFADLGKVQNITFDNFDTSNVTSMFCMFGGCVSLEILDVSGFDTSNVTDMAFMFTACRSLEILDVSNFDTSQLMGVEHMFTDCASLTKLDLSNFDLEALDYWDKMLYGCDSLEILKTPKKMRKNRMTIALYGTFMDLKGNEYIDITSADCGKTLYSSEVYPVVAFVERMYTIVLGRAAEEQGLSDWSKRLMNKEIDGATLVDMFVNSDEFIARNTSDEEYIKILYRAVLGREADTAGLKMWENMLADGWTRDYIMEGLVLSTEFKSICDSYGIIAAFDPTPESQVRSFVKRMYTVVLGRRADAVGLNDWTNHLLNGIVNGAQVADGFIGSEEFANRNLSNVDYVKVLYRAFFNREADEGGFNVWMNELAKGVSRRDVMKGFVHSVEFSDLCAQYGIIRGEIQ